MKRSTIELEIPDEVIEEAQGIARGRNRSVESVLQDGLVMVFGTAFECEVSSELLGNLSNEHLWEIVNRRMPWAQDSRLRELTARSKRENMTKQESEECENLLAALDRQILLRSQALLIMKKRGLDVDSYLGL